MSLTHQESQLFAQFWLKAAGDAVLHAEDAGEVARAAERALIAGATPCARERLPQFDAQPRRRVDAPVQVHSSWVH